VNNPAPAPEEMPGPDAALAITLTPDQTTTPLEQPGPDATLAITLTPDQTTSPT
jgi:hypothetical protein